MKSLFDFLTRQNYLVGNPFAAVARPRPPSRPLGSNRTLTLAQWDHLEVAFGQHSDTELARRLVRAMRLLYATGLRLDEITRASTDDLHSIDYRTAGDQPRQGCLLSVTGKGERTREVPVPQHFIEDLERELGCAARWSRRPLRFRSPRSMPARRRSRRCRQPCG